MDGTPWKVASLPTLLGSLRTGLKSVSPEAYRSPNRNRDCMLGRQPTSSVVVGGNIENVGMSHHS